MTTSPLTQNIERSSKVVHVAVGVIVNALGEILIAKRHATQHQGGLWEFPGGKVEAGEGVRAALKRELFEELGIHVRQCTPEIQIQHQYADKTVLLDVWRVTRFDGAATGKEGQPVVWVAPHKLNDFAFPEANKPIINAVTLPHLFAITPSASNGERYLKALGACINNGALLIYLRGVENFDRRVVQSAIESCAQRLVQVVVSDPQIAQEYGVGWHIKSSELPSVRPSDLARFHMLGAACHSQSDILAVNSLNLDYALLSPVLQTPTHPDAKPMGWVEFERAVRQAKCPVYALGGMFKADVLTVRKLGGQGVAGVRAFT